MTRTGSSGRSVSTGSCVGSRGRASTTAACAVASRDPRGGVVEAHAAVSERAVRAVDYRPERADLEKLMRLALPVEAVQVGMMVMGVVDTIMVGRVSATDLAAVEMGHLY